MSEQATACAPGSLARRLRRLVYGIDPARLDARLTRIERALDGAHALEGPAGAHLDAPLARIERALNDLAEVPRTSAAAQPESDELRALAERLAALEKQISRAGREQLKTNALAEAQLEQQRAALEAMRTAGERYERDATMLREQLRTTQRAARLDLVRAILPALDGLDEALRSGTHVLDQAAPLSPPRRGLFRGLRRSAQSTVDEPALRESMRAWLDGLRFVRQRLLDVLAAEGVRPMDPEGRPFEPHQHTALEVVPATDQPPGTVVSTLRQGYLVDGRIMRHAEVAVAGDTGAHDASRSEQKAT